jgi:hypothetical protein
LLVEPKAILGYWLLHEDMEKSCGRHEQNNKMTSQIHRFSIKAPLTSANVDEIEEAFIET